MIQFPKPRLNGWVKCPNQSIGRMANKVLKQYSSLKAKIKGYSLQSVKPVTEMMVTGFTFLRVNYNTDLLYEWKVLPTLSIKSNWDGIPTNNCISWKKS